MNLYEIKEQFREWQRKVIENYGEVTDEDLEELKNLESLAEDKIEGYAVIIKESLSEADIYKAEAERLLEMAKKKSNLAERLKRNLDDFMQEQGKEKFESIKTVISYRKSTVLDIAEDTKIPKRFLKIEEKIDKAKIKEHLNMGGKLKGCSLVTKQNIQIK